MDSLIKISLHYFVELVYLHGGTCFLSTRCRTPTSIKKRQRGHIKSAKRRICKKGENTFIEISIKMETAIYKCHFAQTV